MWTAQVQLTDKQVEVICKAARDADMLVTDFVQVMMTAAIEKEVWKQ